MEINEDKKDFKTNTVGDIFSDNPKIISRNVSVYYNNKKAISDVSLDIGSKEIISLIGPSGCGKSTFLRCFNRMNDTIDGCKVEGKIFLDNENIYDEMSKEKACMLINNINDLKIILANEATSMLHGKDSSKKAEMTAKNTFEKGFVGESLPTINLEQNKIKTGLNVLELVLFSKLLSSKSEIRRMIRNKGIKINNETVNDEKLIISIDNFNTNNFLKLSHGKKNHVIIKLV